MRQSECLFSKIFDGIFIEEVRVQGKYSMPDKHFHNTIELYFLMDGEREYFIDPNICHIYPGSGVLIKSNQIHNTIVVNSSDHYHRFLIQINADILDEKIKIKDFPKISELADRYFGVAFFEREEWKKILGVIEELKRCLQAGEEIQETAAVLLIYQLLFAYIITKKREDSATGKDVTSVLESTSEIHRKMQEVTSYLREHCQEPCNLSDLSTVNEYLVRCRVKRVCKLLRETKLSITEVAMQCGFGNITYFERVFLRVNHFTPKEFRKIEQNTEKMEAFTMAQEREISEVQEFFYT